MKVMVFTPTWVRGDGTLAMRPECEASVVGQDFEGEIVREIGTFNPFPGRSHRNVLAQYARAREMFLESDCGALLTLEHDVAMPRNGLWRLVETLERGGEGVLGCRGDEEIGVVYGVYMLRHGSLVVNAWEFVGEHAMGESLTLRPEALAAAREAGVARVSGVGWGCTLIRREVVEAVRFHDGGANNPAGDIAFAMDCLYGGVVMAANFDVACDHYDGELRLRAFGGAMNGYVKVAALQDVVVLDGRESRRLVAGNEYEVGRVLASDLVRAGYVEVVEDEEGAESAGEGEISAVAGREGDEAGGYDMTREGELAAVEPAERAVARQAPRRRGGKKREQDAR